MNTNDLIYAAGFIDGEGCITTCGSSAFRITISGTDRDVLDWFQDTFGGSVNDQHLPANVNHSMAWKWIMARKKELNVFLKAIVPYLKIKDTQVNVVIGFLDKYPNCKTGRRRTPQEFADFAVVKTKLRALKTDKHKR
jgi:hypothetical protein